MKKKLLVSLILICITIFVFGVLCVSAAQDGYLTYTVSKGEVTITDCDTSVTEVVIPETIEGYPVTSIGDGAFYNCSTLMQISIPDNVIIIGDDSFYNCSSLLKIAMPDRLISVGYAAFYECNSLEMVDISNIESWCNVKFEDIYSNPLSYANNLYINGELVEILNIPDTITCISDYAFYDCDALTSVNIPEGVTSIGKYAFMYCSNIKNVIIPESVTNIGEGAFKWCINLLKITIPKNVKQINNETFCNCYYLKQVNIPKGVTSIGEDAFRNCAFLTNIIIPDTVTSIGNRTFYYCPNLASITIPNSITKIGNRAFYGCSNLKTIFFGGSEEQWNDILISDGNDAIKNTEIIYVSDGEADKKEVCITTVTGEKIFTCIPSNLPENSTIILACYNGEKTVEIQHALNTNETIYFMVNKEFDKAKVMVWESIENLKPVCTAELI